MCSHDKYDFYELCRLAPFCGLKCHNPNQKNLRSYCHACDFWEFDLAGARLRARIRLSNPPRRSQQRADVALMPTPDGHSRLEVSKFHNPKAVSAGPNNAPANMLGIRRIIRRVPCAGNIGSAFLGCTIYICRNELTVPMKLLRCIRFIYQIDDYSLSFLETQEWPGKLVVIRCYRDDLVRRPRAAILKLVPAIRLPKRD